MDYISLFGWIVVISIISASTTSLLHYYISQENVWWLILSIICSILLVFCYIPIIKESNSGILYTITKIVSIVLFLLIALLVWNEPILTRQWIGLVLAIASVVLLSI
jgi:multidrug transporter EmrE-like cation transporter